MCLDTIVRSRDRALMRRACQRKRGFSNCPCGFKCGLDSAEQSIHEAIVCRTTLKLLVPKALGAFGICKNEDLSEPEALNIASLFLQKIPTQSSHSLHPFVTPLLPHHATLSCGLRASSAWFTDVADCVKFWHILT